MATYVPVANVAQVKLLYTMGLQKIMNNIYFENPNDWSPGALQNLSDAAKDHWENDVMSEIGSDVHFDGVEVVDLTTQNSGVASTPADFNGQQSSSAPLGPMECFCIKFNTANRGRSFKGRIYLPGLLTGDTIALGVLSTAKADLLLQSVTEAIDGIKTQFNFQHVVVSRYSGKLPNGKPAPRPVGLKTPVTSITYTDRNVDVQRRRAVGRGQ